MSIGLSSLMAYKCANQVVFQCQAVILILFLVLKPELCNPCFHFACSLPMSFCQEEAPEEDWRTEDEGESCFSTCLSGINLDVDLFLIFSIPPYMVKVAPHPIAMIPIERLL